MYYCREILFEVPIDMIKDSLYNIVFIIMKILKKKYSKKDNTLIVVIYKWKVQNFETESDQLTPIVKF